MSSSKKSKARSKARRQGLSEFKEGAKDLIKAEVTQAKGKTKMLPAILTAAGVVAPVKTLGSTVTGALAPALKAGAARVVTSSPANAVTGLLAKGAAYGSVGAKLKAGTLGSTLVKPAIKGFKQSISGGVKKMKAVKQMAKGAAKMAFNDREWYTARGEISPAFNPNRPMGPKFTYPFTKDPTIGSVAKLVDFYVNWPNFKDSKPMALVAQEVFRDVRAALKTNLVYGWENIRDYFVEGIALKIFATQMERQVRYCATVSTEFPDFNKLWNMYAESVNSYGPVRLIDNEIYSDTTNRATISAMIDLINTETTSKTIAIPSRMNKFLDFYFGTLFVDHTDKHNDQYMLMHINTIYTNLDGSDYAGTDITAMDPNHFITLWRSYANNELFNIISADLTKLGNSKLGSQSTASLAYFNVRDWNDLINEGDLHNAVYSFDFIQAVTNAYTDKGSMHDGFIRLDFDTDGVDNLSTFMFLGAVNPLDSDDPLSTPLPSMVSMGIRIDSNQNLHWEEEFDQGNNFDFSQAFMLMINSSVYEDAIVTSQFVTGSWPLAFNELLDAVFDARVRGAAFSGVDVGISTSRSSINPNALGMNIVVDDDTITTGLNYLYVPLFSMSAGTVKRIDGNWTQRDLGSTVWTVYAERTVTLDESGNKVTSPTDRIYWKSTTVLPETPLRINAHITAIRWDADTQWATHLNTLDTVYVTYNSTASTVVFHTVIIAPQTQSYYLSPVSGGELEDSEQYHLIHAYSTNRAGVYFGTAVVYNAAVVKLTEADPDIGDPVATLGYPNLTGWVCEQVDSHIPVRNIARVTYNTPEGTTETRMVGSSLFKESYVPFFYNVKDLSTVSYRMVLSLLSVVQ